MKLTPVYARFGLPVTAPVGPRTVSAWQRHRQTSAFGAPRMTDIPANKPPYVSASERCP
jgi:hypothetical protein